MIKTPILVFLAILFEIKYIANFIKSIIAIPEHKVIISLIFNSRSVTQV